LTGDVGGHSLFARQEHFARIGSTNDVVRDWLATGVPEVCLAVADEQTAGRGREGRTWVAPPGSALLLSLGFRPTWIRPDRVWQLAAVVALAMADAAEAMCGLPDGAIRLKWPNDLVVTEGGPAGPRAGTLRKLAGVLGETDGLGSPAPRVVIGIGINGAWPAANFPADLASTMTSLHEVSGGQSIATGDLLMAFADRLGHRLDSGIDALRAGGFDAVAWQARQATTGHDVRLELPDGSAEIVEALGVDVESGALIVRDPTGSNDPAGSNRERRVFSAEIRHVRLAHPASLITAAAGDRSM
jgi:BirA family transcriptional regulator, biotin operon repressor / biotin---[acetyl-CoA-carboxylase] ligase